MMADPRLPSDRMRRVQGLRSSGAAGPHKGAETPRSETERRALTDQDPPCDHQGWVSYIIDRGSPWADIYCVECGTWLGQRS